MGDLNLSALDGAYISTAEASRRLGVSKVTVHALIRGGKLPARRIETGARPSYAVPAWACEITRLAAELTAAKEERAA